MTTWNDAQREPMAEALSTIAALLRHGLPVPLSIDVASEILDGRPRVVLHVDHGDLVPWLAELDLPAPEWQPTMTGDVAWAEWPEDAFTGLPFRLVCGRRFVAEVSA